MPDYQVLAVKGSKEWQGTHGPMLSYTLTVRGPEGRELDCEINKKPDSKPPAVGETIDGTLKASDNPAFLPKLKANFSQGGGRARDPKDTAAMSRSAAQDRALAYMQIKATMGTLTKDFKPADLIPVIEWFQNDVKRYQAESEPGMVHGLPVRNEPERTGTPEPTTPSAEYQQTAPDGTEPFAA